MKLAHTTESDIKPEQGRVGFGANSEANTFNKTTDISNKTLS